MEGVNGFYSTGDVARLARVPASTLTYWSRKGYISPSLALIEDGEEIQRGYSFEQLRLIRMVQVLREKDFSLRRALDAVIHLRDRLGPLGPEWSQATVYIRRNELYVEKPDSWGVTAAHKRGQRIYEEVLLQDLVEGIAGPPDAILLPREFRPFVQIDPEVKGGLPVIRNTRLPTRVIAEYRKAGMGPRKIIEHFPFVTLKHIRSAIEYERYLGEAA